MFQKEIYRSPARGAMTLGQHETWQEKLIVPEKGHTKTNITCPACHASFQVKIYSKSRARLRKLFLPPVSLPSRRVGSFLAYLLEGKKGL